MRTSRLLLGLLPLILCGCLGSRPLDPKLEDAVISGDWDEVLELAPTRQHPSMSSAVADWLTVEAHRRLSQPNLTWEATARLQEAQSGGAGGGGLAALGAWSQALLDRHEDAPVAWELRSSALWWLGDYDGSSSAAQRALELAPNDATTYIVAGRAEYGAGNLYAAIEYYTKAIELNPRLERAYYWRGNAWYDQGQHGQAIADLDEAIKLDPKYAVAYAARGNVLVARQDLAAAIKDYDKALELNPRLAEAWLSKGKAHAQMGERVKAGNAFRKFISIAPEVGLDHLIPEARQELDALGESG